MSRRTNNTETLSKPRLSVDACRLVYDFAAYIKRWVRRPDVSNVASDVMDGHYRNDDAVVREMKHKGLIRGVYEGTVAATWELTDFGREVVTRVPFVPGYVI